MSKIQSLGIDLGTSNCAMALSDDHKTEVLSITQIVGPNRFDEQSTFASALYIPNPGQFSKGALQLPWMNEEPAHILGNFARETGSHYPDRLVISAKSWLCNRLFDPQKPSLPWMSEAVDQKISPFGATCLYLEHLKTAFKTESEKRGFSGDIKKTEIVLTVPASFDEAARNITALAAVEAGFGKEVVLLEEPQAAFYAWLGSMGKEWRSQIRPGEMILICDVGGGTTDFSLIAVSDQEGNLELERISVGKHILLGGDNMDLALGYCLRSQLEDSGKTLDEWQFHALIHSCRKAKEKLFETPSLDQIPISVPARGSGLLKGTVSTKLDRRVLNSVILEGFFALTPVSEMPLSQTNAGLAEFGLPYASDAVISKHLAQFLTASLKNVLANSSLKERLKKAIPVLEEKFLAPDAVLFNGGIFRSEILRKRVLELLQSWSPQKNVRELHGLDPDLAVARGASLYGYTKLSGKGFRIRAGTARSYYIGLEPSVLAIPGFKPPVKALCVAEQGMEEGEERVLEGKEFGLLTGAIVHFRFFSSRERSSDKVGTILPNAEKELEETKPLEMTLPEIEGLGEKSTIPVQLHTRLNELGTLQLWMQHQNSGRRFELNFSVRTE